MQFLAQPFAQLHKFTALELRVQVRNVSQHLFPNLRRDDVTELIRWKIAHQPNRPMNILQTSLRIVRNIDAEILFHPRVPRCGHIFQREFAFHNFLFQLKPHDDVQTVRRFVCLDANEGWLHFIDRTIKRFGIDAQKLFGKSGLDFGIEEFPKRATASDQIFPQAALRFVQTTRRATRQNRAFKFRRNAVFVQTVSAFVHRAEERRIDIILVISRGDANIVDAGIARKWMHRRVEPPRISAKTEILDDVQCEFALPVDGEFSVQAFVAHRIDARANLGDERNQIFFQRVENCFDFDSFHSALEIVEEWIVDVIVRLEAIDVTMLEFDVFLKIRQKECEIGLLTGFDPGVARERGGACHFDAQFSGNGFLLFVILPRHADQACVVGIVR